MAALTLLRRGLVAVAVAGTVVIAGLTVQQTGSFGDDDEPFRWRVAADAVLTGFELEQAGVDGPTLQLSANRAILNERSRQVAVDSLTLIVFQAGDVAARLSAAAGSVNLTDNRVTVRGDGHGPARLALASGPILTAPVLTWEPDAGTITAIGPTAIHTDDLEARGAGAVIHVADRSVRMSGGVTVTLTP